MQETGCPGIYEIAHAFRDDRAGKAHLREFTMVEWYRRDYGYLALVEDVVDIMERLQGISTSLKSTVDCRRYKIISIAELFETCLRVKPRSDWGLDEYGKLALSLNLSGGQFAPSPAMDDLPGIFTLLYDHCVREFTRDFSGVLFLKDYPGFLRGMARLSDQGWAMRVEAYLGGLELCSGYQELDDPDELLRTWESNNEIRRLAGKKIHPVDHGLIHVTKYMNGVSGMALGLERTLMALYGIKDIRGFNL